MIQYNKLYLNTRRNITENDTVYRLYSGLPDYSGHKVTAYTDLRALRDNYQMLRQKVLDGAGRNVRTISVVKADAYGHGADRCVRALLDEGCDFFAVSCIEEAAEVRRAVSEYAAEHGNSNYADILMLGYTYPDQAGILAELSVTQALLSDAYARELSRAAVAAGVTVRCHVAIDTGMNRIGYEAYDDATALRSAELIAAAYGMPGLDVQGMFTHFARADEEYDTVKAPDSHMNAQATRYGAVLHALAEKGIRPRICHICNSAASVRFPDMYYDAVRLGIMLYGVRPSEFVSLPLRPVMSLCTLITHIHTLVPGQTVSYGGHFSSTVSRRIATLPIGYADGFIRAYSGAEVTVNTGAGDFKAPIVGRICMDQCMVDVTDIPAQVGDKVTMFGNAPAELEALAARAGTIEYECLCLISSRVPRLFRQ